MEVLVNITAQSFYPQPQYMLITSLIPRNNQHKFLCVSSNS